MKKYEGILDELAMNYSKLIRNWHEKASETDYFSRFVFEYLAFIAYIKTQKYYSIDPQKSVTDRTAIQNLKRDEEIKKAYLEKISDNTELKQSWLEIKKELDGSPLGNVSRSSKLAEEITYWNCSHDKLKKKTIEEKSKISGVLHSLEDWENMVEFWYSIRNNLFHGGKDPETRRDQFAVKYGYFTLRDLMVVFLNDN
jgi:hypothetical protein